MNPHSAQADVVDLTDYLSGIRQYRVRILLVTLVCAAIAVAVTLLAPRSYVASLTLAVSQPKFGDQPNEVGAFSPASFRPLFESRSMAVAVIKELGLDKPPHNLRPSRLISSVVSIEEVHGTNLIKVTATYGDPQLAASIAQRVAEHAVDLARKVNVDEGSRARTFISEQVKLAKDRLERAETAYRTYREQAQVEAVKKDADATLQERSTVLDLLVKIEAEKAKLARLEEELGKRKRVDVLKRTIDSEPLLVEALRDRPDTRSSVLGTQLQTESISGVFEVLDSSIATSRGTLAGLEKQRTQLINVHKVGAATLPELSRLYARESELARLLVERDLAQKIYLDVAARLEVARLQVGARSPQLEVIDPAVAPDAPESRNVLRDTIFAALLGLTASSLVVMLLQAFRTASRRETGR